MGPLPAESDEPEQIERYQSALRRIEPPVTDEEAKALVECFGPDDCFGLAWSLVHLVETSPTCVISGLDEIKDSFWKTLLINRTAQG